MNYTRKIEVGHYEVEVNGDRVGTVVRTGTARDNYPWEWYLAEGMSRPGRRATGFTDTKAGAVECLLISATGQVDP